MTCETKNVARTDGQTDQKRDSIVTTVGSESQNMLPMKGHDGVRSTHSCCYCAEPLRAWYMSKVCRHALVQEHIFVRRVVSYACRMRRSTRKGGLTYVCVGVSSQQEWHKFGRT